MTDLEVRFCLSDDVWEARKREIASRIAGGTEEPVALCREAAERANRLLTSETMAFQTCIAACSDILTSCSEAAEAFLKQLPFDGIFQKTSANVFPTVCRHLTVMRSHRERLHEAATPLFSALERLNGCKYAHEEALQTLSAIVACTEEGHHAQFRRCSEELSDQKARIDRLTEDVLHFRQELFVWRGETLPLLTERLSVCADVAHRGADCDLPDVRRLCTEWIVRMRALRSEAERFCEIWR